MSVISLFFTIVNFTCFLDYEKNGMVAQTSLSKSIRYAAFAFLLLAFFTRFYCCYFRLHDGSKGVAYHLQQLRTGAFAYVSLMDNKLRLIICEIGTNDERVEIK